MSDTIGVKIEGTASEAVAKVCDTILTILISDCDEATKQTALQSMQRVVLQQNTVTGCSIWQQPARDDTRQQAEDPRDEDAL